MNLLDLPKELIHFIFNKADFQEIGSVSLTCWYFYLDFNKKAHIRLMEVFKIFYRHILENKNSVFPHYYNKYNERRRNLLMKRMIDFERKDFVCIFRKVCKYKNFHVSYRLNGDSICKMPYTWYLYHSHPNSYNVSHMSISYEDLIKYYDTIQDIMNNNYIYNGICLLCGQRS